ncbi:MAG: DUF3267 domain-containing protein [Lachnospiraceae bacterium]|nr:DUF3267 domain-containing protein [Lachnospiraceae bacterium]
MRLHYKKKFDGNVESLPHGEHKPGAVKFKEAEDPKKLSLFANGIALGIYLVIMPVLFWRGGREGFQIWGCIIALLLAFPHEILHGICFKEDVYLYTNYKNGMLFVVGPEDMSKARFIFMSMLPNLVFGFVPFLIFLICPQFTLLGSIGAFSIPMGAGDYYTVFHALTQMPKGARTYLYGFNSYWYMP